jgi:hypothetical protein
MGIHDENRRIEGLSNDTHGGTMMSDRAYARTFGMKAYREMKLRELAANPPAPAAPEESADA